MYHRHYLSLNARMFCRRKEKLVFHFALAQLKRWERIHEVKSGIRFCVCECDVHVHDL